MVIPFSVCDAQGNILRSGTCSPKDFEKQACNPGEIVVPGKGNDIEDIAINGKIKKRSAKEIEKRIKEDYERKNSPRKPIQDIYSLLRSMQGDIKQLKEKLNGNT